MSFTAFFADSAGIENKHQPPKQTNSKPSASALNTPPSDAQTRRQQLKTLGLKETIKIAGDAYSKACIVM